MAKTEVKQEQKTPLGIDPAIPNAIVVVQGGALAAVAAPNFEEDAGRGMEGATAESYAIPFISVLQKGSPQVDEASGVALEGAKQGMFFENVTGRMFDGRTGIVVVPCAYRRVYLRWGPRASNGGFKGELTVEEVNDMRLKNQIVDLDGRLFFPLPDGTVHNEKCDRVADVRNHYVMLINPDGSWTNGLISLGSTQIKKSKQIMSMLASVKVKGGAGMYTPASWANKLKLTTVPESNDKGNWMGVRPELVGLVDRKDIYDAGKQFNDQVRKGMVEAKYEEPAEGGSGGDAAHHEPGAGGGTF